MANARGGSESQILRILDSIVDLEFYMPVREHRVTRDGGANLVVASELEEDGLVPVGFYVLGGAEVQFLSHQWVPPTPTLALVPVETDFSTLPGRVGFQPALADAGPVVYMVSSYIPNRGESSLRGSPELELHAFVRNALGDFVSAQCAGEHRAVPFFFDQDEASWSGPEVMVLPEDGIGTNPIQISVWEDDETACGLSGGRPPRVDPDVIERYNAWGPRATVTVSLVNQVKVVSFADLAVPLVLELDPDGLQADDEVGEARIPSCWTSSGGTAFVLRYSNPSHDSNGWVKLDYRFGQRDPICPPPSCVVHASGPDTATPFAWVTVTATTSNCSDPVTYNWTINGSPACGDEASCTGQVGDEGSYTTFEVTVIDGRGATPSDALTIFVPFQGCPECLVPAKSRAGRSVGGVR